MTLIDLQRALIDYEIFLVNYMLLVSLKRQLHGLSLIYQIEHLKLT